MSRPDEYTREHMDAEGVVHRDKAVSKIGFQLLSLIPLILFTLAAIAGGVFALASTGTAAQVGIGAAGLSAILAAGFAFMWATLSVVRTVVTDKGVHVQVGIWGPRVPHERIKSIRIAPKPPGVRVGKRFENGKWVSSYIVRQEEHVELQYTDEDGSDRWLRFSADDPKAVVDALNRQRRRRIDDFSADNDAAAEIELAEEEAGDNEMRA